MPLANPFLLLCTHVYIIDIMISENLLTPLVLSLKFGKKLSPKAIIICILKETVREQLVC